MGKTEELCCAAWLDGVPRRGDTSSGLGGARDAPTPDLGVAGAERRPGLSQAKGACVCPGGSLNVVGGLRPLEGVCARDGIPNTSTLVTGSARPCCGSVAAAEELTNTGGGMLFGS